MRGIIDRACIYVLADGIVFTCEEEVGTAYGIIL